MYCTICFIDLFIIIIYCQLFFMSSQTIFFCIRLVIFLQMNWGLLRLQLVLLDLKNQKIPNAKNKITHLLFKRHIEIFVNITI